MAPGIPLFLQTPEHSEPTAHLQRMMSPSGSLTGMTILLLHPLWTRMTGSIVARGVELISLVSVLLVRLNLVATFQLENGLSQQQLANPMVILSPGLLE